MKLNYPTLLFCNMATGTLYVLVMWVISVRNPELRAHRWFTWAFTFAFARNLFLGATGYAPSAAILLDSSLCSISCFYCIYQGCHWVVIQRPLKSRFWPAVLLAEMALLSLLFLLGVPHTFLLSILPVFVLGVLSIRILLRNRKPELRAAVFAGIAALISLMVVILLRSRHIASNFDLRMPTNPSAAAGDPLWLIATAAITLVSAYFFIVCLWFCEIEYHRILRLQATTDPKTGALNARALNEEGERELARATRHMSPVSVLAVDLDNFKRLNDTYGHPAGDEVLRCIVQCISDEVRTGDFVARTGGEEFVVLLPETAPAEAHRIAERIRLCISDLAVPFEGERLHTTISVGVTSSSGAADRWLSLLSRADTALYNAKRNGRNRVEVFSAEGAAFA